MPAIPAWLLIFNAVAITVIVVGVVVELYRRHNTPERKEQRRRLKVHKEGRLIEGVILDFSGPLVDYRYTVRGVDYAASQDLSALSPMLPAKLERLIGLVTVKYLPQNPANSIVLCEAWSGLPHRGDAEPEAESNQELNYQS
jgi:hypothetical protein